MIYNEIEYQRLSQLSQTDLAYISGDPRLRDFYSYEPTLEGFAEAIEQRKKFPVDRPLLLEAVKEQYSDLSLVLPVKDEELLSENTFFITTAHQPVLLTGPLFHIYKIASTIHLANDLTRAYPGQKFIPAFVMSGEDHDWEEINHFYLFGRRYEWEREAGGPCGRFSTEGLEKVIWSLEAPLEHSAFGKQIIELLRKCLDRAKNYGQFHTLLVDALFKDTGLLIINLDDVRLKRSFIPLFEKEILYRFSHEEVPQTQEQITEKGFRAQAYCRDINLFYMTDEIRERIDPEGKKYLRITSGVEYNEAEILHELHQHPERFSPNVILRPLYQEYVLPNLAYIGGGGEIAYWLERRSQFHLAGVHFPMLVRRNSLLILDHSALSQIEKLDLELTDLMEPTDAIIRNYLLKHSKVELNYDDEINKIRDAYQELAAKAEKLDPTLSKAILAEESKHLKTFDQLGSRLLRTEKHQHETQTNRIQRLKEKLFPEGGLQERHDNFLAYYANEGAEWIKEIIGVCDPFKKKFILLGSSQK